MPMVAARGSSPAPARRPTNPPKSAPSPQSRGSGAQVLPGPAEAHGARSWARERTAGLKAQEAGEEEAFQNPLTPRGMPRPLPESAASPGHAVNGGWPDAAEARHRPRGPGPKPPAVPAVLPTRGEMGTSHLVCGGTTAARDRLSGKESIGSGPRPGHARPRRWPLGGETDAGERQAVSGTGTRVIRLWTPPQRVRSPRWRRGTGGATHPGSLPARRPRGGSWERRATPLGRDEARGTIGCESSRAPKSEGQLLRAPRWGQRARPNAEGPVDRHRSRGEAGRALEDGDAAQAGGCGVGVGRTPREQSWCQGKCLLL